jgi:hypothetical protein
VPLADFKSFVKAHYWEFFEIHCLRYRAGAALERALGSIHFPPRILTRPCFFNACSEREALRLPISRPPTPARLNVMDSIKG